MNLRPVLCCVCSIALTVAVVTPSTLAPIQLEGVTGVALFVFVDRHLSNHAALEAKVRETAVRALARDGYLSIQEHGHSHLRIEVLVQPDKRLTSKRSFVLQTRVEWREAVYLVRDPSIGGVEGIEATTWADQVSRVEGNDSVNQAMLRDIDWLVGRFASAVKSARTSKKSQLSY